MVVALCFKVFIPATQPSSRVSMSVSLFSKKRVNAIEELLFGWN